MCKGFNVSFILYLLWIYFNLNLNDLSWIFVVTILQLWMIFSKSSIHKGFDFICEVTHKSLREITVELPRTLIVDFIINNKDSWTRLLLSSKPRKKNWLSVRFNLFYLLNFLLMKNIVNKKKWKKIITFYLNFYIKLLGVNMSALIIVLQILMKILGATINDDIFCY